MNYRFSFFLATFALMLACAHPDATAATRYVSPDGLHVPPFTSWPEAATNIQAAIDACLLGDTVAVTNGTYGLAATLHVTNQVILVSANGRDSTFLDGGGLPPGQDAVFLMFGTLDGFTVTNAPRHGVKSEYGEIVNSRITHSGGTGIDSYTTPRIVTNSTLVVTNTIVQHSGSNGIFTCAVDTRIFDCLITGSAGTGVSLRQNDTVAPLTLPRVSNFLIRASTVSSNMNSGIALAFWNFSAALPNVPVWIEDCLIEHNFGRRGGGISDGGGVDTDRSSGVQITRSTIRCNRATSYGGGVAFLYNRSPTISHTTIEDNTSEGDGGGLSLSSGSMVNCLVRNNFAFNSAGGVGTWNASLINNTIIFNEAAGRGGGTADIGGSSIRNCIVYLNKANNVPNLVGGSLSYSCTTPLAPGIGNISSPPGLAGFRNWRLMPGSPCIDAGSFDFAEGDYDLEGDPRIWGGGVDMGADEYYPPGLGGPLSVEIEANADRAVVGTAISFQCDVDGRPEAYVWQFTDGQVFSNTPFVDRAFDTPGIHTATVTAWNPDGMASNSISVEIFPGYTNYVAPAGLHVHPFTNWAAAATNIQDAISANIPGGVVLVDDGVYDSGEVVFNGGLPSRIAITNVLDVISVNGPEFTSIVGQGPLGTNAVRCAYVGQNAGLIGFTLAHGHTRTEGDAERDRSGGGAWCEPGGQLLNCIIRNNAAGQFGGGVRNGTVAESLIISNTATDGGGSSGAALVQCRISGNAASGEGGGIHEGTHVNVLVAGNLAAYGGGVARARLNHATVAQNHATLSGGGVYRAFVSNSIVYFNSADADWPNYFNSVCRYSCTTPDPQSIGNVTNDPRLANVAAGIFRLRGDSPAINAAQATGVATDLPGIPRPQPAADGGPAAPDMGAYEYTAAHYVSPDGGHVWPFLTWDDAAHDIQSAVDAADPLDLVLVSNGVYNTGGRIHQGTLTNRVVIDQLVRVAALNGPAHTIIEGAGPVGDSALRGVYLGAGATLAGFTIRNGATRSMGDPVEDQSGGGIRAGSGAVVSNCIIETCTAEAFGGGVYGGYLVNSFLNANAAASGGGLARGAIDFCTVTHNSAVDGGGVFEGTGRYSIVYFNTASGDGPNVHGGSWDTCCVVPDPGGPGHVTGDPRLLALNDYRLASDSPCIDAVAVPAWAPGDDLDNTPRPLDGNANGTAQFDIGAQEYIHSTADTDGDGLSDYDEIFIHRTDPLQADTDGDGQTDGQEILAGTDPLDPGSFFAITRVDSNEDGSVFLWPGLSGRLYTILATEDLISGLWTNRPDYTDRPGMDGLMSFTNETPPGLTLYRVRVHPAP